MSKQKHGPVAKLREQVQKLDQLCAEQKDGGLRAAADFDNYRRRVQQEMGTARQAGVERLMCDLLPVLDNFERAEQAAQGEASVESLRRGVELIRKQFRDVLKAYGLEEFSCVGEAFDPNRAEAVSFIHTDEHEPDMVASEECRGYLCNERVIRPARVVVARPVPEEQGVDVEISDVE